MKPYGMGQVVEDDQGSRIYVNHRIIGSQNQRVKESGEKESAMRGTQRERESRGSASAQAKPDAMKSACPPWPVTPFMVYHRITRAALVPSTNIQVLGTSVSHVLDRTQEVLCTVGRVLCTVPCSTTQSMCTYVGDTSIRGASGRYEPVPQYCITST